MKKSTIVLTAAALAAALLGTDKPSMAQSGSTAQSLASLTAKGYDANLASNALAANSDAAALLAGINANRRSNGLPVLALDPALGAAAMYQETDQIQKHFSAFFAYLADGVTRVGAPQMAADFGSPATGVQEYAFGNGFFMADTDNWPALLNDWQQSDADFAKALNDPTLNVCGINLVDSSAPGTVGQHVYKWVLVTGNNPNVTANAQAAAVKAKAVKANAQPTTAQSLASLTAKGYDANLASNALAANSDAAALLAGINANRRSNGLPVLALDPALGAAAMYQETDQIQKHFSAFFAYLADGVTRVGAPQMAADFGSPATGVQEYAFGNGFFMADTDNWPALLNDWQQSDADFAKALNDPTLNVCGINLVDSSAPGTVGQHVYKWVLVAGNNPNVTTTVTTTGATINVSKLNPSLAAAALAAKQAPLEAAFLQSINNYRASVGAPALATDAALYPAAFYQARDASPRQAGLNDPASLAADFGSLRTAFADTLDSNWQIGANAHFGGYFLGRMGTAADPTTWNYLVSVSRSLDPAFAALLGDVTYSHCGLSIADTGLQAVCPTNHLPYEVYQWVILAGK